MDINIGFEFLGNILSAFIGGLFAFWISKAEYQKQERKKLIESKQNASKIIDHHLLHIEEITTHDIKVSRFFPKADIEEICDDLINECEKLDDHKYEVLTSIRNDCNNSEEVKNEFLSLYNPIKLQVKKFKSATKIYKKDNQNNTDGIVGGYVHLYKKLEKYQLDINSFGKKHFKY